MTLLMPDLPAPLAYGTVIGNFVTVLADSADAGDSPDALALNGIVSIKPTVSTFRILSPVPRTVVTQEIKAKVVNGQLLGPDGITPLRLMASSSPSVSPSRVQYVAKFQLDGVSAQPPGLTFDVPAGGVIDLGTLIPYPPAAPIVTVVSEQTRVAAEAARDAAVAAAADATGATDAGVATLMGTTGSATQVAVQTVVAASAEPAGLSTSTKATLDAASQIAVLNTGNALAASGTVAGDPELLPFTSNSPWRLGIARLATFAPQSDARSVALGNVDANGQAWINSFQYSHPLTAASDTDPLATVTDTIHTSANFIPSGGSWLERIPATARIAGGSDKHMHIFDPDDMSIIEHFGAARVDSTHYTVKRRHRVNLYSSGIGPQNGTRAYGGSAIGGLIRRWEIDPTDPNYTGRIDHPLALALRSDQLLYSGKLPAGAYGDSYDARGYGLKLGYVWPASEQDYSSDTTYTGSVPMGTYFALPGDLDLTTLGLSTTQGMMMAKALQDYGSYVTDRSGTTSFYVEDDGGTATGAFVSALKGGDFAAHDLKILFKALRVVTSNGPLTPNGGPATAARRGVQTGVSAFPPIRSTAPNPASTLAYIDSSTLPPTLKGWNGTGWVAIGGGAAAAIVDGAITTESGDVLTTEASDILTF